ncbi:MAG: HD domain-containing protein [Candidatus Micrarchaeota archaeon]
MKVLDYAKHAKAGPLEALAFRGAARYEPALEGLVRAFVSKGFIDERGKAGCGIGDLVRAAMARLEPGDSVKQRWSYTKAHSIEVAKFGYIMAKEAAARGMTDAICLDAKLAYAGGLIHDVGKTFIPTAILVKELGIDFGWFTAFRNAPLNSAERRIMREEHVAIGTRYVRLFGGGPHIRIMLDMVGLHHVMYNGIDSGVPSYPSLLKGKDLPLHARIAKAADFISAVMPRHYRTNGYISSLDDALAYAVTVAGTELDPVSVRCFITGHYDISPTQAEALIERLAHPLGQAGVSDIHGARIYTKEVVRSDPEFLDTVRKRDFEKARYLEKEMGGFARDLGLRPDTVRSN